MFLGNNACGYKQSLVVAVSPCHTSEVSRVSLYHPVILSSPLQTAVFKIHWLSTKLCWHNRERVKERGRLYKDIKPQWWGELKRVRGRTFVSSKVCLLSFAEIADHQSISWSLIGLLRTMLSQEAQSMERRDSLSVIQEVFLLNTQ